ncbi:MAG: hypothetical protein ABII18_08930 [bacterium]|nr:hypothetical protein [bacterium]MBU1919018.1 hypothetical protein [bacterium]
MSILNFSKSSHVSIANSIEDRAQKSRNKNGCAGCFTGCLSVLIILCLCLGGLYWYLYTMDKDESLGWIAVKLLKNQTININVSAQVDNNDKLDQHDKMSIKISYDRFLEEYDTFSEDKKRDVKINLGRLLKKFIRSPQSVTTTPLQPEIINLLNLLAPIQEIKNQDSFEISPATL